MGRVKQYSRKNLHAHKKKKQLKKKESKPVDHDSSDNEMVTDDKIDYSALTVGKKKQIFKKEKAKGIKARIMELKQQSKKLKKKKLDEKAQKKQIAKEIHKLKASLKSSGTEDQEKLEE